MKTHTILKLASAFVLMAVFAGAAIAGPSNPTSSVATHRDVTVNCPMQRIETKSLGLINPKTNSPTIVAVGSKFQGCTGRTVATMTCEGSNISCSEMVRS